MAESPPASLAVFAAPTRTWFEATFGAPTRVQREGWRHIAAGAHALLSAPTGSGKTLAAFLWCIDRLSRLPARSGGGKDGVRVLYVSPLKALAYDVERNLRVPLAGIERAAQALGAPLRPLRVSVRTGDTPAADRARLARDPGEILITTPESLYLLLGSNAREILTSVDTVIVDEIHALAGGKRGAHLLLSLERLCQRTRSEPQRIGLSATQRPLDEMARFLGGERPVMVVDASDKPRMDLTIEVPVDDMSALGAPAPPHPTKQGIRGELHSSDEGERGIWPAIHPRLLELVRAHRSTIIFTNSRRLCERLAQRLNELDLADAPGERPPLVRAHHGSVAREQREATEAMLKRGELRGIVATSSLELGIDMGAVDLVIQIESPGAVARGLQRIGRAGHSVGGRSVGRIFPKFRGDLLEAAVVARGMLEGAVEAIRVPRNPLDVLAQQVVAMCAVDEWPVAELERVVRRAHSFRTLTHELYIGVLDMLSGRYPADDFHDLRPRIVWDRARDVVVGRRDAKLLSLVNGGTIPDRGMYAVHLGEGGPRIGELDEEMVHESRAGQTFLLGASSWRIVEITRDRVIVQPAPGEPGRMPFWRGEGPGRPIELGRRLGAFVRELGEQPEAAGVAWLERDYCLDPRAAQNLWRYVHEQREVTGVLPSDRSITIERFRDELGDWRICILSPFGARVHAPWALALEQRLGARGAGVQTIWSDDGIVLRFPDADEVPGADVLVPDPDEVEERILEELGRSALFATHFRENAARALLLPRRRPGLRTPLWTQRLRAQNLLAVASRHPQFPILLETYRECLNDLFDVPALVELLRAVRRREVRVDEVETAAASPFARTLAFAYVAAYLYEGDAPLAERKAQALTLDRNLLRELLGQEELRDLLSPAVMDELEAELQGLAEGRQARHPDGLHDLLRRVGDLDLAELRARSASEGDPAAWLAELRASGRAAEVTLAGGRRWIAAEDVARYRDALGVQPPPGLPAVYLEPTPAPLEALLLRYARSHAPFPGRAPAARWALAPAVVEPLLRALVGAGRLVEGELRGAEARDYCDSDVLRQLRRRTLAGLRNQVAPVEGAVLARFLPRWQGVPGTGSGLPRLREVIAQLEGLALPFSDLEKAILPARVPDFQPRMLDELGALGEIVWLGRGALGADDGRIALMRRDRVHLLSEPPSVTPLSPLADSLRAQLSSRGACFFMDLAMLFPGTRSDDVLAALWELVWAGLATNDTFQPLRGLAVKRPTKPTTQRGFRRARAHLPQPGQSRSAGRWSATTTAAGGDTERSHARAVMLLERYGVVSREAVQAEALTGGFASVAQVLRAMEESGQVRRGYFVEGLSGAQFAHTGAVNRLRALRPGGDPGPDAVVLSAVNPANPYGALLPWPGDDEIAGRPRRVAGARVVLVGGLPVLYLERGGRHLRYFAELSPDPTSIDAAVAALRDHGRRRRPLRIGTINGTPALRSEHAHSFERAGLRVEPGGLVLEARD